MIGRCGYTRPASLIEWESDESLGSMTKELVGCGTESVPFVATIFGNSFQGNGNVWMRALATGTLNWSFQTWAEAWRDNGLVSLFEANRNFISTPVFRQGSASASGTVSVSSGNLIRLRFEKNGTTTSTLDKISVSLWI